MSIENAVIEELESRLEATKSYDRLQELDPDEIELVISEITRLVGRVDRLCFHIVLRPKGLDAGVLDSVQFMRVLTSQLNYHLKHPLPAANGQAPT